MIVGATFMVALNGQGQALPLQKIKWITLAVT